MDNRANLDVDSRVVPFEDIDDENFSFVNDYWGAVKSDRFAPAWRDFNLVALPPDAIPGMTIVDYIPGEVDDFRYRFWGTRQAAYKVRDYTGLSVRDLRPMNVADAVIKQYQQVYRERRPLAFKHNIFSARTGIPLEQTTLRLPLSNDGETITNFASYCEFPKPVHEVREFFAGYLADSAC